MSRPEYAACVSRPDTKTWCGNPEFDGQFTFTDLDHAAINGEKEGRLVVCAQCMSKSVRAILNGHEMKLVKGESDDE